MKPKKDTQANKKDQKIRAKSRLLLSSQMTFEADVAFLSRMTKEVLVNLCREWDATVNESDDKVDLANRLLQKVGDLSYIYFSNSISL
jgi:hypothetical protein